MMPGSGVGHQGRRPGIRNLEKSNGCGEKPDAVGVYFALVCWLVSLFNRYVSNVDRAWQAGLWGLGAQRGSQHSKEPQLRTQQAREAKKTERMTDVNQHADRTARKRSRG